MTFKIVYDHSAERETHARGVVRHHLKLNEEKYPHIPGMDMAVLITRCYGCDEPFARPLNSSRYECLKCHPPLEHEKKGIGF